MVATACSDRSHQCADCVHPIRIIAARNVGQSVFSEPDNLEVHSGLADTGGPEPGENEMMRNERFNDFPRSTGETAVDRVS